MHIVVCIKQIIDPEIPSSEFKIDFEAKQAVEDQGEWAKAAEEAEKAQEYRSKGFLM